MIALDSRPVRSGGELAVGSAAQATNVRATTGKANRKDVRIRTSCPRLVSTIRGFRGRGFLWIGVLGWRRRIMRTHGIGKWLLVASLAFGLGIGPSAARAADPPRGPT